MKTFLNGDLSDKACLTVNSGLNYGRFFGQTEHAYEIRLSKDEFIGLVETTYNTIRDEIKLDDEMHQDSSDFSDSKYVSLPDLLYFKNEFDSIFKTYLDRNLFMKIFPELHENKYVINCTDSCRIEGNEIIIKGRAYEKNL